MHIIRLWECFVLVNKNISGTMKINNGSQESSKPINYISHWLLQSREKLFVWHLSWLDIFVVGVKHLEIKWTMLYVYNHSSRIESKKWNIKLSTSNLKEHPKVKCKSLKRWNKLHAYTCSSEYNKTVLNGSL